MTFAVQLFKDLVHLHMELLSPVLETCRDIYKEGKSTQSLDMYRTYAVNTCFYELFWSISAQVSFLTGYA